jgi:thiol-disulfide isomerase/thioredoxin/tetratricopeptide (TPR) repeat protein
MIRTRRIAPALAALLFAATLRAEETSPPLAVPFVQGRPLSESLKRAKAEKKVVLVDVFAVWCGPCKIMDRTTFSDPSVAAWVKANAVAVKVDAEKGEGRKIAQRYMVSGFPTILFLDPLGNEIDRLVAVYPPAPFVTAGKAVLDGRTPLLEALARLKKNWTPGEAVNVAQDLARRNDVARLRPIVVRLVSEEADLGNPDANIQFLTLLAALEDFQGHLSPETADLVATFLTRIGSDVRRPVLALALGREQLRRGDTAAARETVTTTLKALGESGPYAADLYALLGAVERKAGQSDAAIAALTKAARLSDAVGAPPATRGEREMDLADALAAAGKTKEARAALDTGLERWGSDSQAYVRASRVALALKARPEAVAHARRAVALSNGENAAAEAALGAALDATGDAAGAAAAWKRASELDPDNAEYRRGRTAPPKKPSAGGSP